MNEKYRPKTIEEIVLSNSIKTLIKSYIEKGNIPNLLFYSESPGTGKTTLTHIITKTLNHEVLELNASKERGIDIIREVIEPFIRTYSINGNKKCVLLSECEQLTAVSQKALKDLMEGNFVKNVYYILTTNQKSKIIKPIKSRCVELDFSYPPKEKIKERLLFISKEEKLNISIKDIELLIKSFYPDMRKMVNSLSKIVSGVDIKEAIESELNFYELLKEIDSLNSKQLYEKIEKISIVPFLHYLFKVYLGKGNNQGMNFVRLTLRDIMWGVDEKIAFIANWVKK